MRRRYRSTTASARSHWPGDDPPLTPAGRRRAQDLAAAVKAARPTAIITTQMRRTVETAQPSANAASLTPEKLMIDPAQVQQNVAAVAAAARSHAGETVLVGVPVGNNGNSSGSGVTGTLSTTQSGVRRTQIEAITPSR